MMLEEIITKYLERHGFERFTPKAVLFDMDGVLYDSMSRHDIAWQQSMCEYGLTMPPMGAYQYEGMRGPETIQKLAREQWGRDLSEEEAQRMYDRKSAIFTELGGAEQMPGILDLMHAMADSGMTIGVVTGSGQRTLIGKLVKEFDALIEASHIVTAYDVRRGKPRPDPYLMGLQKCSVQPWEGIVVENAPLGVRAGVAAQIFTVAVNTGPLPDQVLSDEGANIVLKDMAQFLQLWQTEFTKYYQG